MTRWPRADSARGVASPNERRARERARMQHTCSTRASCPRVHTCGVSQAVRAARLRRAALGPFARRRHDKDSQGNSPATAARAVKADRMRPHSFASRGTTRAVQQQDRAHGSSRVGRARAGAPRSWRATAAASPRGCPRPRRSRSCHLWLEGREGGGDGGRGCERVEGAGSAKYRGDTHRANESSAGLTFDDATTQNSAGERGSSRAPPSLPECVEPLCEENDIPLHLRLASTLPAKLVAPAGPATRPPKVDGI